MIGYDTGVDIYASKLLYIPYFNTEILKKSTKINPNYIDTIFFPLSQNIKLKGPGKIMAINYRDSNSNIKIGKTIFSKIS